MRHGFLLLDKPVGPTSHDMVANVRKALHEQKAGHLGTLDPAASGLLVVAVGQKALKIIEFFNHLDKEYEADIRLGAVSTTYDAEGHIEEVKPKPGWNIPEQATVQTLLDERFTGKVEQVPPTFSAVHINGQRAYDLARRGEQVVMPSRTVEIARCEVLSYHYPDLKLRIHCGSGTYIRSLAHDLGQLLRCGSYLKALRRTRVGKWNVRDAVTTERMSWTDVIPLKDILQHFPGIELSAEEADHLRHGRKIQREVQPGMLGWFEGLPIAVLVPSKEGSGMAQPRKVL